MPPNSYTRGSAASLQGLIITEVQKESPTNDFGYPYLLQALGDERNRTKILWTQLFEKSSPTDIKRVAFSSSHKHLLLLVTSFLIKKERFFTSIWREREAVPSGKPHGGMSSPTSKCCSDFYCHPAASQRRQGLPETWPRGYTIAKADPSVGSAWMGSRRRGGPDRSWNTAVF